ncbi:MAG: hypothetical protein WB507_14690 [Solirubrobacterales bacterium]
MNLRVVCLLIASIAILSSTVAIAAAEEVSQEAYVAAVEPICHKNTIEIERDLRGVRGLIKHNQLKRGPRGTSPRLGRPCREPIISLRGSSRQQPPKRG